MERIMEFCEECSQKGGTIPKYYWDGVVAMMHEECAKVQMERNRNRKIQENSVEGGS